MKPIDLRSDTVTHPTNAMREAMYHAELGDDQFDEDPTVNRLQEMAAERMGKEAAILVSSGTQGNLSSILAQCRRGDEIIIGDRSHVVQAEACGVSVLGGIAMRTIANQPDGTLAPADIEAAVRGDRPHYPRTRLLVVENTHNLCGGAPIDRAQTDAMVGVARRRGLLAHMDGARIFNAAVALQVPAKVLAEPFDSVTFCLSKGLSCPVGSLVCGSKEFIAEVKRVRQILGGAMRQAGIIAAAGIIGLRDMVERLAEDHANAHRLAVGLAEMGAFDLDPDTLKTNMVFIHVRKPGLTAPQLAQRCTAKGVLFRAFSEHDCRLVTHRGIESEDIDRALLVIRDAIAGEN